MSSVSDGCKANRFYCPYFASESEESEEEQLEDEEPELSVLLCKTAFPSTEFFAFFSLPFLPFFSLLFLFVPCHTLVAPLWGALL